MNQGDARLGRGALVCAATAGAVASCAYAWELMRRSVPPRTLIVDCGSGHTRASIFFAQPDGTVLREQASLVFVVYTLTAPRRQLQLWPGPPQSRTLAPRWRACLSLKSAQDSLLSVWVFGRWA